MSTASFQVVYDGPALEGSAIDVRYLAPALLAIGKTIEDANARLNGDRAAVTVRVNASFKTGCFGVVFEVVQSLPGMVVDLFTGEPVTKAKEILDTLGWAFAAYVGLMRVIKWLRGRKISKATLLDNGKIRITADGSQDTLDVERKTIDLLRDYNLMKSLRDILKPLEGEGIESVTFVESGQSVGAGETVTKDEIAYFALQKEEQEPLPDRDEEMTLQVVSVSFRSDNKWRFWDGNSTLYAIISDDAFRRRVQKSEVAFSAGDVLDVRMHKRHWMEGDTMKTEYSVTKVVNHKKRPSQAPLPFDEE
jgi:hypothetical protein